MSMSDKLKYYINMAKKYTSVSNEAIRTMRAARTYASLNEAITEMYNNVLWMIGKCESLTKKLIETYQEEKEAEEEEDRLTDSEICEVVLALNELSNALLNFEKAVSIYEDVYNALNGVEPIVSAKKVTKVAKDGKTIDKG